MQHLDYIIAVDFEATCWANQPPPHLRRSEIIEFPAILMNLRTGRIESEFHQYVMPIESPILSKYCTNLTGINQAMVFNGITLQTVLIMFHEWLAKEIRTRNLLFPKMCPFNTFGNCAFITWTDWDFGICLELECRRKQLFKPSYFNQWIDGSVLFRNWYNYRPLNFADAVTHAGLNFEGRAHSGIDDAKNLAALAYKMVCDGAPLTITKDLTPFILNQNYFF